jgi:hypothetical protein
MTRDQFRTLFFLGPLLFSSIVPSIFFGVLLGEWGSNIIWGSVFGLGWCLAAFASGNIVHDNFSTTVGLVWGWLILVPLYFSGGWLWDRLSGAGRNVAVAALLLSFLVSVPAKTIMGWDEHGLHLPDYSLHLASSY